MTCRFCAITILANVFFYFRTFSYSVMNCGTGPNLVTNLLRIVCVFWSKNTASSILHANIDLFLNIFIDILCCSTKTLLLVYYALWLSAGFADVTCPRGWIRGREDSNCYAVFNARTNHAAASAYCRTLDAALVDVQTAAALRL